MQQDSNLESVFIFLYGPVIGRQVSLLARPRPAERVVILRDSSSATSLSLPELPVPDLEAPVEDPLPIVDIFEYTAGDELARRLAGGWDVLVAAPDPYGYSAREEFNSLLDVAATSASANARAVLILSAATLSRRHRFKENLVEGGVIRRLVFTDSPPPRTMRISQSTRLVVAEWEPSFRANASTEVIALERGGESQIRFQAKLDPARPWTVRALDPAEAEKLARWAEAVGAVPLSDVAAILPATREDIPAGRVLEPRHLTPNGIDLGIEARSDEKREPGHTRHVVLSSGDIVGRTVPEPNWAIVTDEHLHTPLLASHHLHVVRPTKIPPASLLAFLHSDAATRQLAHDDAAIPRIRPEDLRQLRVPQGVHATAHVVDGVRQFRATSQRLADELEARYRTAFDASDKAVIQASIADATTESALAVELVRQATDPLHRSRQFLPHPLARTLRAYDNDRETGSAQDVYTDLLRFGETAITILGILGLAYTTHVHQQPMNADWMKALKPGVPLGRWLDCAKEAAKAARIAGEPLGGLASALATNSPLNKALDFFLTARNNHAHGGGPRSPFEFERDRSELEGHLATCIEELVPLARSEWFVVSSLHWSAADGTFRVVGRSLRGDHPDFRRWETRRAAPLESGVVHVELGPLVIPLLGFCQLRSCPKCLNEELYYPDRVTGSMVRLRSLDRGHQAEVPIRESRLPAKVWDDRAASASQ